MCCIQHYDNYIVTALLYHVYNYESASQHHCTVLHYTTPHYITPQYTTLHYTTLHSTTHYNIPQPTITNHSLPQRTLLQHTTTHHKPVQQPTTRIYHTTNHLTTTPLLQYTGRYRYNREAALFTMWQDNFKKDTPIKLTRYLPAISFT